VSEFLASCLFSGSGEETAMATCRQLRADRGNNLETNYTGGAVLHATENVFEMWQLGSSRWVRNTPTGCGNDLPTSQTLFRELLKQLNTWGTYFTERWLNAGGGYK
jgi:hypothetical protein